MQNITLKKKELDDQTPLFLIKKSYVIGKQKIEVSPNDLRQDGKKFLK